MTTISIKKKRSPDLKIPAFIVDGELHAKLNEFDLTRLMNKHNFTLFLGRPGSGKSSLAISLLQTPTMFKKVYHNIILFCPANSRASVKNDFWNRNLPEEQIYDDLTLDTLKSAYALVEENAKEGYKTLVIMDDVQTALKDVEIQKLLLHMVNNRRHGYLSIWLLCQSYFTIPRMVRNALTNLFIFKVSKNDMAEIFKEQIETDYDKSNNVLANSFKNSHDFIFIDSNTKKLFINFDEIIYNEIQ